MSSSDRPDLVFLSDLYTFSFLTIIVLSRISSSMLKRSGKREYPSFVPYVSGKAMLLAVKCGVVCGFSVDSVYQVEKPPLIICLLIRLSLLNCKNSFYILYFAYKSHIRYCCCSVAELSPTLWDPMDCGIPGCAVLRHLLESAQIHVHWVGDAIQPSHPLLTPLLLPSIFPSIRVFCNESGLRIK